MACGVLGLQHGFDWDHLAAVSDIAMLQRGRVAAIRGGMLYSIGHAATVGLLGLAAILLHHTLPCWISRQHVGVGISLAAVGGYVVVASACLARSRGRAELFSAPLPRVFNRRIPGASDAKGDVARSSVALGVLHRVGAETPTQLALVIATGLAGRGSGSQRSVRFRRACSL
jgi:high-affinity nickel-transport protein